MSAGNAEFETRVNARIDAMEKQFASQKKAVNDQFAAAKAASDEPKEEGGCWVFIKVIQYIFGITISSYSLFITIYGLVNSMSGTSDFLHPAVSLLFLALLIAVLAFCEGTQIALMLLEKVPARDLPTNIFCANRVRMTHALAQKNTERYLVGRQIFVTGIVFLIAKLIYMKPEFAPFCEKNLGFLGSRVLLDIFVYTGLSGSLVVLAFGQLVPQLIVTATPVLQYQLFPTYEIIVIQLFCERLGLAYMANILRDFTRWAFDLVDEPFGVGSGVVISKAGSNNTELEEEMTPFVKFWTTVPTWNVILKYIVGVIVFGGSIALILLNVLNGHSDFTKIQWETSATEGYCKNSRGLRQDTLTDMASCEVLKQDSDVDDEATYLATGFTKYTWETASCRSLEGKVVAADDMAACGAAATAVTYVWEANGEGADAVNVCKTEASGQACEVVCRSVP